MPMSGRQSRYDRLACLHVAAAAYGQDRADHQGCDKTDAPLLFRVANFMCAIQSGTSIPNHIAIAEHVTEQLKQHPFHAAGFEALSSFFKEQNWCSVCLIGCRPKSKILQSRDMHAVISTMDHSTAAQLSAGACLAQVCLVETGWKANDPKYSVAYSY